MAGGCVFDWGVRVREFTPETQDHLFLGIWGAGAPGSLVLGRLRVPAPPPRTSGIGVLGVAVPKTYRICDPGRFPPRPRREYVILGSSRPPDTPEWVILGDSRPPDPQEQVFLGLPLYRPPIHDPGFQVASIPSLSRNGPLSSPLTACVAAEQASPVRRRRPNKSPQSDVAGRSEKAVAQRSGTKGRVDAFRSFF